MNNIIKSLSILTLGFLLSSFEANQGIPDVKIKKLNGATVSSKEVIKNADGPIVLSFWATWCKPCIQEMENVQDLYEDWQAETKVKWIAISIDDTRTSSKVNAFVNGRDYPYEFYTDVNSELKQAMNVQNIPHIFILDKNGEVVYQKTSYMPGDEKAIFKKLQEISAK
jgi:cytochrome c biogenesis protein CcmG, thiol:disulfide interchange protein DsbE